jgi:integrase
MAFALRMAKLTRDPKTGNWRTRKVIPLDCRLEFGKREEKPIWPAHLTEGQARESFGKWLGSVEGRIADIRERRSRPGRTVLTAFEIDRVAQLWHAHLLREDEGLRSDGLSERAFLRYGETIDINEDTSAYQMARGDASHLQWEIDDFVASCGFSPDTSSPEYRTLSLRLLKEYRLASKASAARQSGEVVETPKVSEEVAALTVTGLFDCFEAAKGSRLGQRTMRGYRQKLQSFADFVGDKDARSLTDDDVYDWAAHREKEDQVQPHIIQKNDVAAVSSVFAWASSKLGGRLVPTNIAKDVDLQAQEPTRDREPFFMVEEVRKILEVARTAADDTKIHDARRNARRWCPWLCAYSGARITEATQLRREDFFEEHGTWFFRITPAAGSVKTRTSRRVPLHEHVIAEGFLTFLHSVASGPLFYDLSRREKEDAVTSRAALESIRLAGWLREETQIAKGVRINHAWRHTWKTQALGAGIEERIRDAIAGHSVGRTARKYEHPSSLLAAAMARFPRYALEG